MIALLMYSDGSVHILSLGIQKEEITVNQSHLSVSLPEYSMASLIKCSNDMDAVVCVQEKSIVIYTTLLELRGMISLENPSIVDCCLTRYGLFLVMNREKGGVICKFNYCGDYVNDLSLSSSMYSFFDCIQ